MVRLKQSNAVLSIHITFDFYENIQNVYSMNVLFVSFHVASSWIYAKLEDEG